MGVRVHRTGSVLPRITGIPGLGTVGQPAASWCWVTSFSISIPAPVSPDVCYLHTHVCAAVPEPTSRFAFRYIRNCWLSISDDAFGHLRIYSAPFLYPNQLLSVYLFPKGKDSANKIYRGLYARICLDYILRTHYRIWRFFRLTFFVKVGIVWSSN